MSQHFDAILEQQYPALYQLLVEVAINQYYPDWIDRAIKQYNENADQTDRALAIREIDGAIDQLSAGYDELAGFTNYNLTSPNDARSLLTRLRHGLVDGLATKPKAG